MLLRIVVAGMSDSRCGLISSRTGQIMAWFLVPIMISSGLLYRNWPTGIRVDEAGISIGAIGSARAARRRPTVNHQSRGLFTCPWPAVQSVRIVTDRAELRRMNASPRYYTLTNRWGNTARADHCSTGVLISPFMRAALVIEVNPFEVTASQIRPARFYSNFKDGRFSHLVRPQLSPSWVVPTRHPDALSAALQAVPDDRGAVRGQVARRHGRLPCCGESRAVREAAALVRPIE